MISILVACDPNGVIGKGNQIPWYLPADLKLFKHRTLGSSVIMGRKTWDSLPKKPLIGRVNYVVSHGEAHACPHTCLAESLAGPVWCKTLEGAIEDANKNKKEIYIIGGEQIYKAALDLGVVNRIIMSRLPNTYEGDHFFHLPADWRECEREDHGEFDVIYFVK